MKNSYLAIMVIAIVLLVFVILLFIIIYQSAFQNKQFHNNVANTAAEEIDWDSLLIKTKDEFDNPNLNWKRVWNQEEITVDTTFTQQEFVEEPGVRTYKTTSWLKEADIKVERLVALLDGGWLEEEVWFKKDFKGGQRIKELEKTPDRSAWIAQYISDIGSMFSQREFLYLLFRRDFAEHEYSRTNHPEGKSIKRQVGIVYKSVPHPVTEKRYVRAIQFPSVDCITLYDDGTIKWEHIMAFHIAGYFPLWLVNNLEKSAAKVLFNEAANMRKH